MPKRPVILLFLIKSGSETKSGHSGAERRCAFGYPPLTTHLVFLLCGGRQPLYAGRRRAAISGAAPGRKSSSYATDWANALNWWWWQVTVGHSFVICTTQRHKATVWHQVTSLFCFDRVVRTHAAQFKGGSGIRWQWLKLLCTCLSYIVNGVNGPLKTVTSFLGRIFKPAIYCRSHLC